MARGGLNLGELGENGELETPGRHFSKDTLESIRFIL